MTMREIAYGCFDNGDIHFQSPHVEIPISGSKTVLV
jgi:hypothetical protein